MRLVSKRKKSKGIIETYDIIYLGGHPSYPKAKIGKVVLNICKSNFELVSTARSSKWLTSFSIPYDKVIDFQIVQRKISSIWGRLGEKNSIHLNKPTNIHIKYENESGNEILLKLEMSSGITVTRQAKKCSQLEGIIRLNNIRDQFINVNCQSVVQPEILYDITSQIEKLAFLLEKSFITKEEFLNKKSKLLFKIFLHSLTNNTIY